MDFSKFWTSLLNLTMKLNHYPIQFQGYAFAQSVKLAVFETVVDASIEKASGQLR